MAKAYYGKNIVSEFSAAIELLCVEFQRCTPTDVLRLVGVEENNITRQVVLDVAHMYGYRVKKSGRGFAILDW
jgi:hypothetical protein